MSEACTERAVFVHLPKTGGTSTRHGLENLFRPTDILRVRDGSDFLTPRQFAEGRQSWFISGHMYACVVDILRDVSLTIFLSRDPVARFFSAYHYWRTFVPDFHLPAINAEVVAIARNLDFNKFVELMTEPRFAAASPFGEMVRALGRDGEGDSEETFECAERRLRNFDVVLTTENLDRTLPLLLHWFGLPNVGPLPRLNQTERYEISCDMLSQVSPHLEDDLLLHKIAVNMEYDFVLNSRAPRHTLSHHIDFRLANEFVISAGGPVFATGVLPIETKKVDGKVFVWRRIVSTPFVLNFDLAHPASATIEISILTAIIEKDDDAISIRIDGRNIAAEVCLRGIRIDLSMIKPDCFHSLEVSLRQGVSGELRTLGWDQIRFIRNG